MLLVARLNRSGSPVISKTRPSKIVEKGFGQMAELKIYHLAGIQCTSSCHYQYILTCVN